MTFIPTVGVKSRDIRNNAGKRIMKIVVVKETYEEVKK